MFMRQESIILIDHLGLKSRLTTAPPGEVKDNLKTSLEVAVWISGHSVDPQWSYLKSLLVILSTSTFFLCSKKRQGIEETQRCESVKEVRDESEP